MTTLKPCPNPWCIRSDIRSVRNIGGEFYRTCARCGIESPCKKTPEEADAAWNHRPGENAVVDAVASWVDGQTFKSDIPPTAYGAEIRSRFGGKA